MPTINEGKDSLVNVDLADAFEIDFIQQEMDPPGAYIMCIVWKQLS